MTRTQILKKYKLSKVAIFDLDIHHGNGTQEIFYNDETVAYGSIHEFPLFPGTGFDDENGVGNIFNRYVYFIKRIFCDFNFFR